MRAIHLSIWGMVPYSIDLRQKILHACERRLGSQRALADLFGVSLSFIEKLLRRHRATGDIAPKPHAGGPRSLLDGAADTLIEQLVYARYHLRGAVRPCRRGTGRARQCGYDVPCAAAPGLTTQKKSLHASERDTPRVQQARQDYRQRLAALDLRRLNFVDESSVNLAMTRR
jgi:hypothetical protein